MKLQCTNEILCEIASACHAITQDCKGDGAGLSGGTLIDKYITAYFNKNILNCSEHHHGESDIMINGCPFSLKKITGKSKIALNWSKNNEQSKDHEPFQCDMMIINLNTEKWWKRERAGYNKEIPSGIYFIPRSECKSIVFEKNNKTDTLIKPDQLYNLLDFSMINQFMIPFPPHDPDLKFDITKAFTK